MLIHWTYILNKQLLLKVTNAITQSKTEQAQLNCNKIVTSNNTTTKLIISRTVIIQFFSYTKFKSMK